MRFWRRKRDLNPRAGYPTYSLSRGAPSPLGYFSKGKFIYIYEVEKRDKHPKHGRPCSDMIWRRGRDSNSWSLAGSLVFKTSSINHSDTSPQLLSATWIIIQDSSILVNYLLENSEKYLKPGQKPPVLVRFPPGGEGL